MWVMGLLAGLFLMLGHPAMAAQDALKDPDGKTLAVLVDCSTCAAAKKGARCETGTGSGYQDGAPCGQCLMTANSRVRIPVAYDVTITGHLKDEKGQPVKGKFVKLYTPTFGVRTRTTDEGQFFLRLGASEERKGTKPILQDLGTRVMRSDSKATEYALFMLPETHKPCPKTK